MMKKNRLTAWIAVITLGLFMPNAWAAKVAPAFPDQESINGPDATPHDVVLAATDKNKIPSIKAN